MATKTKLELAATRVLEKQNELSHRQSVIDPTTIMTVAQIIMDLLTKCREAKASNTEHASSLIEMAKKRPFLARFSVMRSVKQESENGTPLYIRQARADAILDLASTSKPEELVDLMVTAQ